MRVVCCLLVLFVVFNASQCRNTGLNKRIVRQILRTTFNKRLRNIHDPLIVGGQPADISNFPHQLALFDLTLGGFICGASNISPVFALTAAHCLDFESPASSLNLWGGSTSRLHDGVLFFVTEYTLHPEYDWMTLDNDVAVVRVDESTPLQGHPHVSRIYLAPICMESCCTVCLGGSPITVSGWGRDDSNQIPENLRQVSQDIHDHDDCYNLWGGDITSRMFCTKVIDGRDSCDGDSGSPVIRNGVQVGVVSFGTQTCGTGAAPAVYVRIEDPLIRNFIMRFAGV